MRSCPKCGYEEHPMWRPRSSRVFCDYTKLETLEYIDPKLAMVPPLTEYMSEPQALEETLKVKT